MSSIDTVFHAMVNYDNGDPRRIHHFIKVHNFARQIGLGENLAPETQEILEIAALVHDIGIHKAEELYGSCNGKQQEELGPPIAEEMLLSLGFSQEIVNRVCYLVGHHHTYTNVDGIDYQILLEADFLVNFYEDDFQKSAIEAAKNRVFQTKTGIALCNAIYTDT